VKHREVHPELDVEGCFGCRVAHVGFSAAAMPSRKIVANDIDATERRLRRDGLQPAHVDGAAKIEREATDRSQVETGIL